MSVSAKCYGRLHELVVSGGLAPGTRLAELPLAAQLGVSRPTIREALRRLEDDGLVRSDGRSLRVERMGIDELRGALEMRGALEALHAELAAARVHHGRVAPYELSHLEKLAHDAESATDAGDHAEAAQCNRRFHRAIDTLAANPVSDAALARLWNRILVATERSLSAPHRGSLVANEHHELIDAIATGQAQRAADIARAHVRGTIATLSSLVP